MWRQPASWPRRPPARTATESRNTRRSGRRQREPRGWCGSVRALPYRAVVSSDSRRAGGLSVHHQLEPMPVRIAEVDAAILPRTPAHRDAVFLQFRLQGFVSPSRHVERQMVEVVAGRQRRAARLLEQSDPLFPGVQKNLSFVFPIHGHAENLGVKLFRARDIIDVQHDVVHPIRLNHRFLLNFAAEAQPQRHQPCWISAAGRAADQSEPARPAHCRSAASAIPIRAAADSQLPSRWEAEARKCSCQITPIPCRASSRIAMVSSNVGCFISGPSSDACLGTSWCPESDLNQRPTAYEAVALPLSYRGNAGKRQPRTTPGFSV